MEAEQNQRRALGAFLRARREALVPPAGGRRRTPGLRREEVAAAANVSTTWYVWAEQGRDISLSPQALARVAGALQLSAAERSYMFALAARLDPDPPHEAADQPVPAELLRLPEAIATPAYLLDADFSRCAWNAPAQELFAPWAASGEANLLRFVFEHASAKGFIADYAVRAQRLVAEFRAGTAQEPETAARRGLIDGLLRENADFARYWNHFAVLAREGGVRGFNHPTLGALQFNQHNLVVAAHPSYRLVVLTPA